MANVLVDETSLQNIANTIRAKGGTKTYKPSQMANAISSVYDNRVINETKFAQNNAFWEVLQDKGLRQNYNKVFMYFTDTNFKPRYDIVPTNGATSIFEYSQITDLVMLLDNAGVKLDFSKITVMPYRAFAFSTITHCPAILMPENSSLNLNCTFHSCQKLETIDELLVFEGNLFTQTFNTCPSLKNIRFKEGSVIGQNISFPNSPLTQDSIVNIIETLSDTASGKTLTLKKSTVDSAFASSDDQLYWNSLLALKPNWNISLV